MLEEAMKHGIPWATILVPTPITAAIDYGGASSAVEVLNKMFKLGVDTSPLQRSEEMIRQRVEMSRREQPRGLLGSLRRRRPQGSGAAGS